MTADNNIYLTGLCSRRVIFMKRFRWKYYSLSFALFQTARQPPSRATSFLPGPACRSYSEVNLEPPWARQSRAEAEKADLWPWGQHEGPLRDPSGIVGFPAALTFSHLIWELTENRGCPSSSQTLFQGSWPKLHVQDLSPLSWVLFRR